MLVFLLRGSLILFLNLVILRPIKYDGIMPTSDKIEYLPPICFLCSIYDKLNF